MVTEESHDPVVTGTQQLGYAGVDTVNDPVWCERKSFTFNGVQVSLFGEYNDEVLDREGKLTKKRKQSSDGIMDVTEAHRIVEKIKDSVDKVGKMLVDLRDRKGWKALGYSSWDECTSKEFEGSRAHLYRLMSAEEVRRELEKSPIGDKANQIPEGQLRELACVEPGQRAEVYQKAVNDAAGDKVTAKHVRGAVEEQKPRAKVPAPTPAKPEPKTREVEASVATEAVKGFEEPLPVINTTVPETAVIANVVRKHDKNSILVIKQERFENLVRGIVRPLIQSLCQQAGYKHAPTMRGALLNVLGQIMRDIQQEEVA
jgi:hypothetical protein